MTLNWIMFFLCPFSAVFMSRYLIKHDQPAIVILWSYLMGFIAAFAVAFMSP